MYQETYKYAHQLQPNDSGHASESNNDFVKFTICIQILNAIT